MRMNEVSNTLNAANPTAADDRLCLWLADDHDSLLTLLVDLLGKTGQIHCARLFTSAEALLDALAKDGPPDAILTDVNMGRMTGVEAIRPIKRMASSTRVFIMTTFYDSELVSSAREAGAAGFFLKSGDWDEAIKRLVDPAADWKTESAPVPAEQGIDSNVESHDNDDPICRRRRLESLTCGQEREISPSFLNRAAAMMRTLFQRQPLPR